MADYVSNEERWLQAACRRIEEQVIEGAANRSFDSILHVRRDGRLISSISCPEPRLLAVLLSRAAAAGFGATELIFVADAYGSQHATNPEGQRWSVGEMQRRAGEPAVAAILYEAVQFYRVSRGGPETFRVVSYRVRRRRVEWDEPCDGYATGLFARSLRAAVEQPHFEPGRAIAGVGPESDLTPAMVRLDCDLGTVRAIHVLAGSNACEVDVQLAVPKDSWSQRRAQRSLARAGLKCKFL